MGVVPVTDSVTEMACKNFSVVGVCICSHEVTSSLVSVNAAIWPGFSIQAIASFPVFSLVMMAVSPHG